MFHEAATASFSSNCHSHGRFPCVVQKRAMPWAFTNSWRCPSCLPSPSLSGHILVHLIDETVDVSHLRIGLVLPIAQYTSPREELTFTGTGVNGRFRTNISPPSQHYLPHFASKSRDILSL